MHENPHVTTWTLQSAMVCEAVSSSITYLVTLRCCRDLARHAFFVPLLVDKSSSLWAGFRSQPLSWLQRGRWHSLQYLGVCSDVVF